MVVKTITVTEQAYRALKSTKRPRESFSQTILRITHQGSLDQFFGILTEKEGLMLEKTIMESRRRNTVLHQQRMKEILRELGNRR